MSETRSPTWTQWKKAKCPPALKEHMNGKEGSDSEPKEEKEESKNPFADKKDEDNERMMII